MDAIVTIVILVVMATSGHAQFSPTLSVDSCTQSKLKIVVENAADGGIIYIQGQGASCKQTTNSASTTHEFDFGSCGIAWASSFKMIVQQKSLYQTGDDKQIPIMCIADLTDLTVDSNLNTLDKDDDAGQNLTVKPTATMKLYRDGLDIGGSSVQLTDYLTMSIELDTEFQVSPCCDVTIPTTPPREQVQTEQCRHSPRQLFCLWTASRTSADFDILAKECTASTISIIESSCAADTDLFPDFAKPLQGYLANSFGAFRTTDLNGGSVAMTFSCTLTVCQGSCSAAACSLGDGFGRKKRGISKRQADDNAFDDISVGSTVMIAAEEVILESPDDNGYVCMDKAGFIVGLITILLCLIVTSLTAAFMVRKVQEKRDILNKLNGGMSSISMG